MKNLKTDGPVMFTEGSHELISTDKALLTLTEGVAWVRVVNNGDRVGIAFAGPSRLAVDAIAETDAGAVGRSVVTRLEGMQLFLGETQIERLHSFQTRDYRPAYSSRIWKECSSFWVKHRSRGCPVKPRPRSCPPLDSVVLIDF